MNPKTSWSWTKTALGCSNEFTRQEKKEASVSASLSRGFFECSQVPYSAENTFKHTHLLRNIIANFVVECIARAQTIPTNWQERFVDSTRTTMRSMLSTSLLWGMFWCSIVSHQNCKIGRLWQLRRKENEIRLAGSRLGRLPWTKMKKIEQVRGLSVPNPYHCATDASSLDGDIWSTLHPPAWKRNHEL